MTSKSSKTEINKARVRKFLDSFSNGSVPRILENLHEDALWWVPGTLPGLSGSYTMAQISELLAPMGTLYKPGTLRVTPLEMTAENDRVAVEASSYAELHNGRIYNNSYHFLFELRDGKISQVKEYMDTHHAWETFLM